MDTHLWTNERHAHRKAYTIQRCAAWGGVSMNVLLYALWSVVPGQATHIKNTKIVSLVFEEILLEG